MYTKCLVASICSATSWLVRCCLSFSLLRQVNKTLMEWPSRDPNKPNSIWPSLKYPDQGHANLRVIESQIKSLYDTWAKSFKDFRESNPVESTDYLPTVSHLLASPLFFRVPPPFLPATA